jgi:2-amino-4-hydroxy-6-hydroxymethyldihydropteridine diphosphokinase
MIHLSVRAEKQKSPFFRRNWPWPTEIRSSHSVAGKITPYTAGKKACHAPVPLQDVVEYTNMVNLSAPRLLLALGANRSGVWGPPRDSLARALSELQAAGVVVARISDFYKTPAVGSGRQPSYLNAVAVATCALGPSALLRMLKRLERRAGRRVTPPLQPRPLDIDILDWGGRRLNWPAPGRKRPGLVLPHPLLHERAFVLVPLLEVAPHWVHPVLGVRAKTLLARLPREDTRCVRKVGSPELRRRHCA